MKIKVYRFIRFSIQDTRIHWGRFFKFRGKTPFDLIRCGGDEHLVSEYDRGLLSSSSSSSSSHTSSLSRLLNDPFLVWKSSIDSAHLYYYEEELKSSENLSLDNRHNYISFFLMTEIDSDQYNIITTSHKYDPHYRLPVNMYYDCNFKCLRIKGYLQPSHLRVKDDYFPLQLPFHSDITHLKQELDDKIEFYISQNQNYIRYLRKKKNENSIIKKKNKKKEERIEK